MKPEVKEPVVVKPTPVEETNPFTVENDMLLKDGKKVPGNTSPHISSGRNICDFVVMHYTGSHGDFNSSINWSRDPKSKVSWHITIGRKGEVKQNTHGFRAILWHAGRSAWYSKETEKEYKNLNKFSVGIEMANTGKLTWNSSKQKYISAYKAEYEADDVYVDQHGQAWEKYDLEQIKAAKQVALAIAKAYKCVDILGHNEIAPGRKADPGAAFPLADLKDELRSQEWYEFNK